MSATTLMRSVTTTSVNVDLATDRKTTPAVTYSRFSFYDHREKKYCISAVTGYQLKGS